MMQRQVLLPAAFALFNAACLSAQDTTSSRIALGEFIDGVRSGADSINSAVSAQSPTSSSSSAAVTSSPAPSSTTPSAAAATSSAAAGGGGLSNGARTGIIVGCVIAAVLIIGFLAGICCCLMLRKRKRRRAATPVADDHDHEKPYSTVPANPGRNYSPISSHNRNHHSMEQHPTVPLLAAGAISHGRHSQAPSLSQHPAMRPSHENPFRDSVGGMHPSPTGESQQSTMNGQHQSPHTSHHGAKAGVAGAAAAGAAGNGLHKHHKNQHHTNPREPIAHHTPNGLGSPNAHSTHQRSGDNLSNAITDRPAEYEYSAPHPSMAPSSHYGPGYDFAGPTAIGAAGNDASLPNSAMGHESHHGPGNLAGPAVAGAAAYGASHGNPKSNHSPTTGRESVTSSPLGPSTGSGLVDTHNHNQSGTYPAFAPATHDQNMLQGAIGERIDSSANTAYPGSTAYPSPSNNNALDPHSGSNSHQTAQPRVGLDTLPSSGRPLSGTQNGMEADAGGAAMGRAAAYDVHQQEGGKPRSASRSRSRSRPRSGILPTHNDADRPPTPFGLSGIGQPYEDMHVHVLQNEAPSSELQRSLNNPKETSAILVAGHTTGKGYSTPPMVPNGSSAHSSYSNNETSSNSGGEQYSRVNDPYQPATPRRASAYVPPWEQHTPRYSGVTPPTSAGIVPPPVPWESTDYAQQRRQSHSPRQSVDGSGRRHSRSPATSINGQPRRLRFEDLQPEQVGTNRHSNPVYGGSNQHPSSDGYGLPYDNTAYGDAPYAGIGQAQ